ncbi:HIT family protein [Candidatus Woesearchaeota archaeon]|nr:HIT family protein [Candidatus Woesearchaeota archaeon]
MTKGDCIFCRRENIKDEILWESQNFFVKVGIGLLAPGHVMVISKAHYSCFGELPPHLKDEFFSVKNRVHEKVSLLFSEPVVYEHGIYSQSVSHAHMHFVPAKTGPYLFFNMRSKIFSSLPSEKVDSVHSVAEALRKYGSYIFLEEEGDAWIYNTQHAAPQAFTFRKEFGRFLSGDDLERDKEWIAMTKGRWQGHSGIPARASF